MPVALTHCTLQDLKAALKEAGLPVTGKKDELVDRLLAAKSTASAPAEAPAVQAVEAAPAAEPSGTEEVIAAAGAPSTEPAAEASGKHAKIVFSEDAATVVSAFVLARPGATLLPHTHDRGFGQAWHLSCMCLHACACRRHPARSQTPSQNPPQQQQQLRQQLPRGQQLHILRS